MTLLSFKIAAALIILLIALLGGIWPLLKKIQHNLPTAPDFPMGESFAAGIFLGAGLLHMLPDSVQAFYQAGYEYPLPFLIAALGFLLLLFLEHISHLLEIHRHSLFSSLALLTTIMLSIHSLLEGAALGISGEFTTVIIIFIAIIAHKGAASFALSAHLNRSHLSFSLIITAFVFFAVMTPLGILVGSWVISISNSHVLLTPVFSALAAGTFLYIGTLQGLGHATLIKHCARMREFGAMLVGFTVMAVVGIWT